MIVSDPRTLVATLACASLMACVRIPNPNFIAGEETGTMGETSTGDGDGDGDPSGDGDGDPSGDGDGDPSGDGDGDLTGDGDGEATDTSMCEPGTLGCPCTVLETCDEDLACVLGECVDASSCDPVDDNVQISVQRDYAMGDPQPVPPMTPETFICSLGTVDNGDNSATLIASQCNDGVLTGLTMQIEPVLPPLDEFFGAPLAASITLVEADDGFYMRINAAGLDLYYIDGPSLFYEGITMYPWAIGSFSSSCGETPSMCGVTERLAMLIDEGVVFDGNAGVASGEATAWVETNLDVCGVKEYEVALIAH